MLTEHRGAFDRPSIHSMIYCKLFATVSPSTTTAD